MQSFDAIIIGGGFLGVSTAYQLSRAGVRTLLLEAGDIGSGTSGSCSGRAQVCEGHLDPLNIKLILEGFRLHETLEEELGFDYEWRKVGLFLLLRNEKMWQLWKERSQILSSWGISTEIIDQASLQRAEPNLNTNNVLGAAYSVEGMLNPLRFTHAYAGAAVRQGAKLLRNSKVVGMEVKNRKVTMVRTATDTYSAGTVAVMAGAWEHVVTRMAGVEVPIRPTHAESFITEPIPPVIFHNIGLADSYEIINGKAKACTMGIHPEPNGTLDIAEAVTQTDELHQRTSAWGLCAMAAELVKLFPILEKVRVVRSWGRPTSFTPDEEPLVGWVPQLDNMYVATSLVETITAVPILSKWMAMMIQGQTLPESLDLYSPARFAPEYITRE
jgi:sarcosine oxidase subunit beta